MARGNLPARIRKWRGEYYIFYTDHGTGRKKRVKCQSRAATNDKQRQKLLQEFRSREVNELAEVGKRGTGFMFDASLKKELDEYLKDAKERAEAREENPDARVGISKRTFEVIVNTIEHFKRWLKDTGRESIQTGALDVPVLVKWCGKLAIEPARLGNSKVKRSAATLNQYRRTLLTALNHINRLRPRRFPDFEDLKLGLKPIREKTPTPEAFAPGVLAKFYETALANEDPERVVTVRRSKGGKEEKFLQPVSRHAATPVSRLFLLLCLTGCRRGEALALKWSDVNLDRGRIVIRAEKTGRTRWLMLTGAAEGEISPGLLNLLRQWRQEDPKREYVLPHKGLPEPKFPKQAWDAVNRALKANVTPQKLRQNFTSYAASLGVPASVAAMWQGHGVDVAERHYRAQLIDRQPGQTFEAAMGLQSAIDGMLEGSRPLRLSDKRKSSAKITPAEAPRQKL